MSLIKKIILCSTPIMGMTIVAPIILTSCSSSHPSWSTSNLPSGMTVNGSKATVRLTSSPFSTTGLTSSSTIRDISNSATNNIDGLGKIFNQYKVLPNGWLEDISRGIFGIWMDTVIQNGSFSVYWYLRNYLDMTSTHTLQLTLTGLNS